MPWPTAGAAGRLPVVGVQLSDPAGTQATIEATLGANPEIDGVLTLGPTGATPALKAFEELGILGDVQLATFDLSADVLQAIADGEMLFAIDQQQYLQGYLPVVMLTLYNQYGGLLPGGGGVVLTGPGFVTQGNAAAVIELSPARHPLGARTCDGGARHHWPLPRCRHLLREDHA